MDSTFQITNNHGQDVVTASVTVSADDKVYAEIAVPAAGSEDYVIGGDPDDVASYSILPDFAGTLTTTNDPAGTPDVIAFAANKPLAWHNAMGLAKHFANAEPWTLWTFANPGAVAGTVKILIMRDGTP